MEKRLSVFGNYEDGTGFNPDARKFAKIVSAVVAVSLYSNGDFSPTPTNRRLHHDQRENRSFEGRDSHDHRRFEGRTWPVGKWQDDHRGYQFRQSERSARWPGDQVRVECLQGEKVD